MIKRTVLLALLLCAALASKASASYFAFEQITVAGTALGFTAGTITPTTGNPPMTYASCRVRTAEISIRLDGGTPTSSVGQLMEVGDLLTLTSRELLLNFKAIRTGSTSGQLDCWYSAAS